MLTRRPDRSGLDLEALFAPLEPFARIGVAVSGGPDSLALMLMLADWAKSAGKAVLVYTVDHGLRPEAATEAAMVAGAAERLGLKCRVLEWTGDKPETGIQAAARRARYRLIGAAMRTDGAEVLVTAHHIEDQAETVLMRLAHGSGLSGLSGMAPFGEVEGVRICRPLLAVGPAMLRRIVEAAGLRPVADPSNENTHYERVRWRQLLPALGEQGLDAAELARFTMRMARADLALAAAASDAARLIEVDAFGLLSFDLKPFRDLPAEIGIRLLLRAIDWAGGGMPHSRLGQVEAVYDGLVANGDGYVSTLCGAIVTSARQRAGIYREAGRMRLSEILLKPDTPLLWDNRFAITANASAGRMAVAPGAGLTREAVESFCGHRIETPMAALFAAPVIRDRSGTIVAIGATMRQPGLSVAPSL